VIVLIVPAETFTPYISARLSSISRVVIPLAYIFFKLKRQQKREKH
jgi:hypothetical protein